MRLCGPLDAPRLATSLRRLVARHEVLRTSFVSVDGTPVQCIAPSVALPLPLIDLSGLPPGQRSTEAQRLLESEAQGGFDLAAGPLLRTTLLRLTATEHWLLLTIHHIIADGWSLTVLVSDLLAFYEAPATDPLPALPIQYADYTLWQHQWRQSPAYAAALAYWTAPPRRGPGAAGAPHRPSAPSGALHGGGHRGADHRSAADVSPTRTGPRGMARRSS